jgi:hypothetical protein
MAAAGGNWFVGHQSNEEVEADLHHNAVEAEQGRMDNDAFSSNNFLYFRFY